MTKAASIFIDWIVLLFFYRSFSTSLCACFALIGNCYEGVSDGGGGAGVVWCLFTSFSVEKSGLRIRFRNKNDAGGGEIRDVPLFFCCCCPFSYRQSIFIIFMKKGRKDTCPYSYYSCSYYRYSYHS